MDPKEREEGSRGTTYGIAKKAKAVLGTEQARTRQEERDLGVKFRLGARQTDVVSLSLNFLTTLVTHILSWAFHVAPPMDDQIRNMLGCERIVAFW